ncbi:rho guanine nucleotide exchange factor 19 isoform 1-T1 [Menidia menidia]
MAHFSFTDENSHYLRSGIDSKLQSFFGNDHGVNSCESERPTMKPGEQICSGFSHLENGLDESGNSMNQLEEDYSLPLDISSALKSLTAAGVWDLKLHLPARFSAPGLQEDHSAASPPDHRDKSRKMDQDPFEEETPLVSFQSKFMRSIPLYQDYCLRAVRDDLRRLKDGCVSELINLKHLQTAQSPLSPCRHSGVSSPQQKSPGVTRSSPLPQPVRVTSCTLWRDLEEVKASGLLSSLTAREIRLQESMFELIGSEASYLKSLGVLVNHFYASKALKILSKMEHRVLFSNIHHIRTASERFLMDLETRLGESLLISQVGDVVLKHCRDFRCLYVPYVTNMRYQESLVNQLLQQNRDFLHTVKTLESDPVCHRQTLKSFLVLPFQRITRIKLLLEGILKQTESKSASNLEKAIGAIHEILTACDEVVRKIKRIEELVCLEMLLDFANVKMVPLIVSTRFLVLQGPMKQLTMESTYNSRLSFMSIHLHLFNDLLVISSKQNERFVVMDYATFPTHVTVKHLKTEVLGIPPESFLLHLSESQTGRPTAVILVALTGSDKELWMRALRGA